MGDVTARLDDLPLRDDLRGQTPYGAPQAALPVRSMSTRTPIRFPKSGRDILDAVAVALRDVNRYPDREFTALREGFADYLGSRPRRESRSGRPTARTRSSSTCCRRSAGPGARRSASLRRTRCTHCWPRGTGAAWAAGTRSHDYTIDAQRRHPGRPRRHPDVVFLCAPNNPTARRCRSTSSRPSTTRRAAWWSSTRPIRSSLRTASRRRSTLLPGRERLIVSRTMSKAFAFAGARVGYLAAS